MAKRKKIVIATYDKFPQLRSLGDDVVIRAYKAVRFDGRPIHFSRKRPNLRYEVGKTYIERNFDPSESEDCGAGLNVGTLEYCVRNYEGGGSWNVEKGRREPYKLLVVEFRPKDIVAMPRTRIRDLYYGKFRVKRLRVVKTMRWPS